MSGTDSLLVFTTVVKTNSFTAAAEQLGLTPSAISKQISMLEKRLGVSLLNRSTRSLSMTEAGALYYERCVKILKDLEETEALIQGFGETPSGLVRVCVQSIFGRTILAWIAAEFHRAFPDVSVELNITDGNIDIINDGYDVAVKLGQPEDSRLIAHYVGPLPHFLFASKTYLEARGVPATADDLDQHNIISVSGIRFGNPLNIPELSHLENINSKFKVNDLDTAFHLVHAHVGIAFLPLYMVYRHLDNGKLVRVLPTISSPDQPVNIITSNSKYIPPKTRAFIGFVKNFFEPFEGHQYEQDRLSK